MARALGSDCALFQRFTKQISGSIASKKDGSFYLGTLPAFHEAFLASGNLPHRAPSSLAMSVMPSLGFFFCTSGRACLQNNTVKENNRRQRTQLIFWCNATTRHST
eukprot:1892065-Rhodomonas_salina.1